MRPKSTAFYRLVLALMAVFLLGGCATNKTKQLQAQADIAKATTAEKSYEAFYGMLEKVAEGCDGDAACMRSVEEMSEQGGQDLSGAVAALNRGPDQGTNVWDFGIAAWGAAGQAFPWLTVGRVVYDLSKQDRGAVDNSVSNYSSSSVTTRDSGNTSSTVTRTRTEVGPVISGSGSLVMGDQNNDSLNPSYILPADPQCLLVPVFNIEGVIVNWRCVN